MKTLERHVILYDEQCPMCNLYTRAFVQTGMLDANGREPFGQMPEATAQLIDRRRACNEIALVNLQDQTVTYGIDSLYKIIGHRFPWLQPVFHFPPFRWLMYQVYAFVSYNRKVIIPGSGIVTENSCVPDFKLNYRLAYLVAAWLVSAWVLHAYSGLLTPILAPSSFAREFAICGGQLLAQSLMLGFLNRQRLINYLGNLMTISLAGSLLLLPALMIASIGLVGSPWLFAGYFSLVVGLMLLEHLRRVKLLQLPVSVTASWLGYRLLVLWVILY